MRDLAKIILLSLLLLSTSESKAQTCAEVCNACMNAVRTDSVYNQNLGAIMNYCNACNNCRSNPQPTYEPRRPNVNYCPNGTTCPIGTVCSSYGCIPPGSIACSGYYCATGQKCGSNRTCLSQTAIDCGNGTSCPEGKTCWTASASIPEQSIRKGDQKCTTVEGARALENRIAEIAAEKKRFAEEAAAQKKLEAQRAADESKAMRIAAAQASTAVSLNKIINSAPSTQKTVTPKYPIDDPLYAVLNDPNQSEAIKQIARIALGLDSLPTHPTAYGTARTNLIQVKNDGLAHPVPRQLAALILDEPQPPLTNSIIGPKLLTTDQIAFLKARAQQVQISQTAQAGAGVIPQTPVITTFNIPRQTYTTAIVEPSALQKTKERIATTIANQFSKVNSLKWDPIRHEKAMEYVRDSPQVKEALRQLEIYGVTTAAGIDPHVTGVGLAMKSAFEAGEQMSTSKTRVAGTLKGVNVVSGAILSTTGAPPGSTAVLNLSGATLTAYFYGYFFGI